MKNFPKLLFFDSYAGVCYFDLDLVLRRIKGLNNNAAIGWREFHAVLDQVPKDLLQPRRIAIDVGPRGPETKFDVQLFRQNALAANFVGALENFFHANQLLPLTDIARFIFHETKNTLNRLLRILQTQKTNIHEMRGAATILQRLFDQLKRRAEGKDFFDRLRGRDFHL